MTTSPTYQTTPPDRAVLAGARTMLETWARDHKTTTLPATARILLNHATFRTKYLAAEWVEPGEMGSCYRNALVAAAAGAGRGMKLRYVEGYVYLHDYGIAFEHAWVEDEDGTVFETTLPRVGPRAYIGYSFGVDEALQAYLEDLDSTLVHGDWGRGFQLHRAHIACCG